MSMYDSPFRRYLRDHPDVKRMVDMQARRIAEDIWPVITGAVIEAAYEVVDDNRSGGAGRQAALLALPCGGDDDVAPGAESDLLPGVPVHPAAEGQPQHDGATHPVGADAVEVPRDGGDHR